MFADLNSTMSDLLHHPGKIYPDVVLYGLLLTLAVILLHLVLALIGGRSARPRRKMNLWERLVYLGILVSVAGLAVTAFFTVLRYGTMRGWWLFAHMFAAGALVALLPLLAITWAGPNRFGSESASEEQETHAPRFFWVAKLMFWLFLTSGLVVVLTMMLSMLPVFGTDGLHALLDIHRYAGLLAVIVLAVHLYCVALQKAKLR